MGLTKKLLIVLAINFVINEGIVGYHIFKKHELNKDYKIIMEEHSGGTRQKALEEILNYRDEKIQNATKRAFLVGYFPD